MKIIPPGSIIGIIGGGQLGRMTALSAANLGYKCHIFCPEQDSPAGQVADQVTIADYTDLDRLQEFASSVDVVTFEFENIPYESAQAIENLVDLRPNWNALYVSQNRLREKDIVNSLGIATAKYKAINSKEDLLQAVIEIGDQGIIKTTELGYDGKGQFVIKNEDDLERFITQHDLTITGRWIYEELVDFKQEISVILARNEIGDSKIFPVSLNKHINGILDISIAPAPISNEIAEHAKEIAVKIAKKLELVGLLTIEFFVLANGDLLVNELAPRPHNSGHWTMDGCFTSQFEQLIRAITGLNFGSNAVIARTEMINLIGDQILNWPEYISQDNIKLHLYGKKEIKPGRKMGHYNKLFPLNWTFIPKADGESYNDD